MQTLNRIIPFIIVLTIWAGYSRIMIIFWGYYAANNPLINWAVSSLLPDHRIFYYALIVTHDLLVNILIAMPIGFLLRSFGRWNLWWPVIATVVMVFLWDYQAVFWGEGSEMKFFSSFGAIMGAVITLGLLPLVYGLAGIRGRSIADR